MRLRHLSTSSLAALLVAAAPLMAQGVSTQLGGRVLDAKGGGVAAATVVIRNQETGLVRTLQTNAEGRYMATMLPVGPYVVTVTKAGFQTAGNIKLNLNLGDAAPLTVRLAAETGAVVEVVAASAAQVDSERTTIAAFVSAETLANMPNFNRSFTNLATLTPQVTIDPSRGGLAIAGQRGVSSSMNIDGGDNNEPFFGGSMSSNNPFQISMEAIREYQVITAGASAEYGRMGGGYVNAITKNGTNDLSGGLFYFTRPQSMVEKQPNLSGSVGANNVGDFKQEQFGFSLGGPIIKDKLFYFVAYDGQRQQSPVNFVWGGSTPVTLSPATIPNDAVLASKIANYVVPNDADTLFVRLDWNLSTDHALQFHINQSKFKTMAYTGSTSNFENTVNDQYKTLSLVGQWNWVINANMLNELRINSGKDEMPRATNSSIPEVSISNVGYYGANPYPREYETKRLQISEALSYVTPVWQIKGGFDYNKINVAETFSSGYQGIYYFNDTKVTPVSSWKPAVPAYTAFQNFQAGQWNQYTQRFSLLPGLDGWNAGKFSVAEEQLAAFLQADVRLTDTVKVGLGLRVDRQTHPDFPIANFATPGTGLMPVDQKMPTDTQFSPRVSLTWTPAADKGNTVVRFSAGRYVSTTPSVYEYQLYTVNGVRMANITFNNPLFSTSATPVTTTIPTGTNFNAANPFSYTTLPTGSSIPKSDIFSFDSKFKNPHTDQVTAGIERGLGNGLVVAVSGIYSRGYNLERLTDLNLSAPTLTNGRLIFPSTRPNINYNKMMMYVSDAESRYQAYTLNLKYQEDGSPFFAQIYYTYAVDKDNDSNERNFSGYSTQNTQRLGDDWSYSDKDRRHNVSAQFSYLHRPSGIQSAFIFRYLSGTPYSVVYSSDMNADSNSGYDRQYLNGVDTGRNTRRGASSMTLDGKLSKEFALSQTTKFSVSCEVFNILNRADTYNILKATGSDTAPTTSLTPAIVGSARQVQLGARLNF